MKIQSQTIGYLEILGAFVLAGTTVSLGKIISNELPVFLTAFLSLGFTLIVMLPLQIHKRREFKKLDGKEVLLMAFQALCGIVLFRVLTLNGLRFTGAGQAGIITSSTPVVMALAGILILKEKMNFRLAAALILTLGGLSAIHYGNILSGNPQSWIGNLLIFGAVLSEVSMTLLRKKSQKKLSSVTNTTLLALCALIMLLPLALSDLKTVPIASITLRQWLILGYYGILGTAAAYLLWGDGALRIPASRIGVCMGSMPLTVLLLSVILNKETGSWENWLGFILIFSAIILISVRFRRKTAGQNGSRSLQS